MLWEAGIRKAKTIAKRLNISERTAYGHVAKLKKGISLERKTPIRKRKVTSTMTRRIVSNATNVKKCKSLRDIGQEVGISYVTVRKILHKQGIHYCRLKKNKQVSEKAKKERVLFAKRMLRSRTDW